MDATSGLLFVALGILVLFVRPARKSNIVFAAFAVFWGAGRFFINLAVAEIGAVDLLLYLSAVVQVAATVALVWLTLIFPRPPLRPELKFAWLAGGVGFVYVLFLVLLATEGEAVEAEAGTIGAQTRAFVVFLATFFLMMAAHLYAIVLWTLRYFHVPADDGRTRRQYALLTSAQVAWVGFVAGAGPDPNSSLVAGIRTASAPVVAFTVFPLVVMVAVAALWLYAQHARPDGHIGRNMAWFVLAVPLLGVAYWFAEPVGAWALTRVVGFALLAIAILRFQLLSIDVKIRWTVSRSTVAAAFLFVFFVVGLAASEFLIDVYGYVVGAVAAGLLFFAFRPLQRIADRVATKAVPGPGGGLFETARAETTYRNAVRMALKNRVVEPDEEVQLAELADGLGIGAARAMKIRHEVGRERTTDE